MPWYAWGLLPVLALLLSAACYHRRYQPDPHQAVVSGTVPADLPSPQDPASPWRLAAIEFDEQGDTWADRGDPQGQELDQIQGALETLAALKQGAPSLNLLVFLHGWHHNADPGDGNLRAFRNYVAEIARDTQRPTMGVFLGWRGRILPAFLDYPTSYWGRHAAARRVGGIRCTEALFRLSREARKDLDDVTVVLIGHSFGARVLETALGPSVVATLAGRGRNRAAAAEDPLHFFPFDLAVLVNEASEAKAGSQILAALKEEGIEGIRDEATGGTLPFMVNLTSTRDKATQWWLPLGQFFGTLPKLLMGGLRSGHYRKTPGYPGQWDLNTHTLAHTPFFHSHRIEKSGKDQGATFSAHPLGAGSDRPPYNDTPYFVMRAEGEASDLICGHNDIFTPRLAAFLRTFIVERLRKGGSTVLDPKTRKLRLLPSQEVRNLRTLR